MDDVISNGCAYCADQSDEPGWIETDNNGPIVRCPLCERREWRKSLDRIKDQSHG